MMSFMAEMSALVVSSVNRIRCLAVMIFSYEDMSAPEAYGTMVSGRTMVGMLRAVLTLSFLTSDSVQSPEFLPGMFTNSRWLERIDTRRK